jgi:hypothetical protein
MAGKVSLSDLPVALVVLGRGLVGVGVSALPRRFWSRWPVPAAALPAVSASLTAGAGLIIGLGGFLRYATGVAETAVSVPTPEGVPFNPAMAVSMFSIFAFALATPLGIACTYLVLSGAGRAFAVVAGAPGGDPVLTVLDDVLQRRLRRRGEARVVALRNAREGPAAPDVLVPGAEAGIPSADWVVVASRLKPGWERGVFVVTTHRWYRLGPREDRETPDGLRAFYPLEGVASAEVIRRSVYYDHPRLSALQASEMPECPSGTAPR